MNGVVMDWMAETLNVDGSDQKVVLSGQGSLTGIAVVHISGAQGR
jgi:hypothetical protein